MNKTRTEPEKTRTRNEPSSGWIKLSLPGRYEHIRVYALRGEGRKMFFRTEEQGNVYYFNGIFDDDTSTLVSLVCAKCGGPASPRKHSLRVDPVAQQALGISVNRFYSPYCDRAS